MARPPGSVAALRQLIATRFPEKLRTRAGAVSTGIETLDEALGGGLPCGRLTEWVSTAPSAGEQLALCALLGATRTNRQRVAWIDGANGFDPLDVPASVREHLLWVRCAGLEQAMGSADLLVRDGNVAVVIVDLRGLNERDLRRWPATSWYRLQRAAENGATAVLVTTQHALVPAVPYRLEFSEPLPSDTLRLLPRSEIASRLQPRLTRNAALSLEAHAG